MVAILDPSVTYHHLDSRPGRDIYYGPLDDFAVRYNRDHFAKLATIENWIAKLESGGADCG
jgi:hypothetical protein